MAFDMIEINFRESDSYIIRVSGERLTPASAVDEDTGATSPTRVCQFAYQLGVLCTERLTRSEPGSWSSRPNTLPLEPTPRPECPELLSVDVPDAEPDAAC